MIEQRESWLQSVFKHGKWYLLTSLLSKGVNFLLLPVYTSQLSTSEYGSLSSINSIGQLVAIVISLYIDSSFGRYYHEYSNKDSGRLRTLFSTTYFFVVIWGTCIVAGSLILSPILLRSIVGRRYVMYALLAFAPHILLQISQLGMVFLRQSLQSLLVAVVQIVSAMLSVSLTIYLLFQFNLGIEARLIGNGAAGLFTFLFFTILFIRKKLLGLFFSTNELKKYLYYSIPLLPNIAGGWIASLSDRLVIAHYDSLASTGIYSFSFQLAHIVYIVQDAITQVLGPVSMSGMFQNRQLAMARICRSARWLYIFMLHVCLGVLLFAREAIMFILYIGRGETDYLSGYYLIPVFALVYLFSSQYRMFTAVIAFHKKNWVVSSAGILMAVINLSLNLVFVPRYGRISAVIATVLSTVFYTVWIIAWAKKFEDFHTGFRWYLASTVIFGAMAGIVIGVFGHVLTDVSLNNIIYKSVFYLLLTALLVLFRRYLVKSIAV